MVPQPSRTLDLERKEELIIQKQIRQATARMSSKQNLPTLIEASPDFNQKKLPYLPNLPASVQIGDQPNIHTWFDQYQEQAESVTTDDIPSLYSVPQKYNTKRNPYKSPSQYDINGDNRCDSRRSRSASITFDLDDDIRKISRTPSKKRSKEKKESKQETQANTFAKESPDTVQRSRNKKQESYNFQDQDQELSMWACRKCTLENPLQEATCMACGGSRLSSIGDIEVPKLLEPKNIVNLIGVDDQVPTEAAVNQEPGKEAKWKCVVCTLENDPLAYYCDACNSQSPFKMERMDILKPVQEKLDVDLKDLLSKFARYFGISCFLAIIIYSLFNMFICLYSTAQSILQLVPEYSPSIERKHSVTPEPDTQEDKAEEVKEENDDSGISLDIGQVFTYEMLGVRPVMMAIFCPVFFYLVTRLCKKMKITPRVPQPM